jgi:hypothetical protein
MLLVSSDLQRRYLMAVRILPSVSLQVDHSCRAWLHAGVCEYLWGLRAAWQRVQLSGLSEQRLRATCCVSPVMSHGPCRAGAGQHTWSKIPLVGSKNASFSATSPAEDVSSIMVVFEGPEPARTPWPLRHLTILEQTDSFHPVQVSSFRRQIILPFVPRSLANCLTLS